MVIVVASVNKSSDPEARTDFHEKRAQPLCQDAAGPSLVPEGKGKGQMIKDKSATKRLSKELVLKRGEDSQEGVSASASNRCSSRVDHPSLEGIKSASV